jgi:hypothetical protein
MFICKSPQMTPSNSRKKIYAKMSGNESVDNGARMDEYRGASMRWADSMDGGSIMARAVKKGARAVQGGTRVESTGEGSARRNEASASVQAGVRARGRCHPRIVAGCKTPEVRP